MPDERDALFDRLERFYDAVPRDAARAEQFGSLVLFVRESVGGWPFYARPRLDASDPPSAADVTSVRARQRDLGLPEAFEWVHERSPDLLAVARSAGLSVLEAPLMVLDPAALPTPAELSDVPVRILDPAAPDFAAGLAAQRAVAAIGFSAAGTARGDAGPAERDAAVVRPAPADLAEEQARAESKSRLTALAEAPGNGAVGSGRAMRVGEVAELAGIATLPRARRRGVGAAVTAALARRLLDDGAELIFLSAGSEDIARVYLRAGFRRVGTACIAEPAAVLA
ncbi:GNAT family N-acetyltransferase [Plantactinospora sp. KBS50]|uniref:GNAT family N-acetyltransferase n=1 Tax=Plantactinospora sp. KBS50 TaxID=2024580 RepID=UPI000BAAD574|nr:GNAT family N-acetyltransferase [Plantactinospora sp. KBS50]ASW57851.1 GNAT family N-acetyltransferase [Plantactinospora sp. KBS50]